MFSGGKGLMECEINYWFGGKSPVRGDDCTDFCPGIYIARKAAS